MKPALSRISAAALFCLAAVLPAVTQTTVTTSGGTANSIPKFTGSSTIGDSAITENGGNVGIGTSTPVAKLEVAGVIGEAFRMTGVGTNPVAFRFGNAGNTAYVGVESATAGGYFSGSLPYSTVIYSPAQPIQNIIGGVARMTIATNGYVGIGTTNPQYSLSVNGTIQAKEVIVNTGWSDYVFQPDYRIRPLTEVAAFIEANHHLPSSWRRLRS
jgi:hypothetical protein